MLKRFRFLRKEAVSLDNSHHVFDDSAPLVTPAPPTLSFSINNVFFLKSRARIAAAYPDGPAPMTTRSNFSIVKLTKHITIQCTQNRQCLLRWDHDYAVVLRSTEILIGQRWKVQFICVLANFVLYSLTLSRS